VLIGMEEQLAFLTDLVSRQRVEILRRLFPSNPTQLKNVTIITRRPHET